MHSGSKNQVNISEFEALKTINFQELGIFLKNTRLNLHTAIEKL